MSRPGKTYNPADFQSGRREFLIRSGKFLGAGVVAHAVGGSFQASAAPGIVGNGQTPNPFQIHTRYRSARPLDSLLGKVRAKKDDFPSEWYADQLAAVLRRLTAALLDSPHATAELSAILSPDFKGASISPVSNRSMRSDAWLEIREDAFGSEMPLDAPEFVTDWSHAFSGYDKLLTFECQIVRLQSSNGDSPLLTRVRYEFVGSGREFYREQRVGEWEMEWVLVEHGSDSGYQVRKWQSVQQTQSRSRSQSFVDITAAALGRNDSYAAQLWHGADYWRSTLDAASGIDIYGHNGISVGDIDNDGYDDLYICQAAGLPNRLFRNRGDGTFEDITESSGLGILENTACTLIVDVNNDGWQDVIVVCASGPQLYLNQGGGKFRKQPDAFRFAHPPQGTFTGAAMADYDRDGWLDVYFCLYVYYQGAEQYKYPLPYYDAENGPPNFLFRNNRDGTFTDVTEQAGLKVGNTRYSFCCGWSDYDKNGWPDLYVVNDFGRKNLYRNNGDGTFSDVSKGAGVEDTGAGMSVSWLDYDNDGDEDLYVANMWTAAGARVAAQPEFQKSAPEAAHAQYVKHAMGNSLFRNEGNGSFTDETSAGKVGMGRWSWSSDSWDFDHDGFADLYVTNGMVSGRSREDLNSFFWREVVAKSPLQAKPNPAYELGWTAINELIRADGTWSGYERNVFYANNRNGTFADISGALGLDCLEDGRSFALTDFDGDGRIEVFLKNRNAPQLRVLKNVMPSLPPSIAFRLRGVTSNRDAIGASVTVFTEAGQQSRTVTAGSGFLSQHSKELHFGLGQSNTSVRAVIRWPSGLLQEFRDLPRNHRIAIDEGSSTPHFEAFTPSRKYPPAAIEFAPESIPADIDTWLLAPILAPDFTLTDFRGNTHQLASYRGRSVLLYFFSENAPGTESQLQSLKTSGADSLAICVGDNLNSRLSGSKYAQFSFPILRADDDVLAVYNILYNYLYDRHRDLSLPVTFLVNSKSEIEKVYQGSVTADGLTRDLHSLPRNVADRTRKALPFEGVIEDPEFRRNYLSYGSVYYQRGYYAQAEASFERALADDPTSAEAFYGLGSSLLQLGKPQDARQKFERATTAKSSYPDTLPNAWNNLGLLATRDGHIEQAAACFDKALRINPDHMVALDNLGNAYRQMQRWPEAQRVFERAVETGPQDAEAHYGLAMTYAQTGDNQRALAQLQNALAIRPEYPEALNNLGILFLHLQRVDDAIREFKESIRIAPAFDQSYINLANVYALEGKTADARAVLQQLLQQRPNHEQANKLLEQLPQ